MCKLAIVIKEREADMRSLTDALTANWPKISVEPDGVGFAVIADDNTHLIRRELADKQYDSVFDGFIGALATAKIGTLHTRFGTVGAKNIANVHQYEHDGLIFAHNGHVGAYSGYAGGEGALAPASHTPATSYPKIVDVHNDKELKSLMESGAWYGVTAKRYIIKRKHAQKLANWYGDELMKCQHCAPDSDWPCQLHNDYAVCRTELLDLLLDGENGSLRVFGYTGNTKSAGLSKTPTPAPFLAKQGESDSLKFLKSLGATPSIEDISSAVTRAKFTGIASLIDTRTKTLFLIGTRAFEVQQGQGWTIIYSFPPTKAWNKYLYSFGLPYAGDQVNVPTSDMPSGVYAIKYSEALSKEDTEALW